MYVQISRIKQFLLKTIVEEPSLQVKKHILQLIAVLAKHELMRGNWNELFAFIEVYTMSNDVNERQVSFEINNLKYNVLNTNYKSIFVLISSLECL